MRTLGILGKVAALGRAITAVAAVLFAATAMADTWIDYREAAWPNNGNVDGNTYTINTAQELAQFAYIVNLNKTGSDYSGKTIKLAKNIDLSGHEWTPIGVSNASWPFLGTFDGNGKTIANLTIHKVSSATLHAGLFGDLSSSTSLSQTIKNIRLTNVDIQLEVTGLGSVYAGAVMSATSAGVIENCVVESGTIHAKNTRDGTIAIGGITGAHEVKGTIRNCVNAAHIEVEDGGPASAGGIVGRLRGAWVLNSQNMGEIKGNVQSPYYTNLGGICGTVGIFPNISGVGLIENCFNSGTITMTGSTPSTYAKAGALFGYPDNVTSTEAARNSYWVPVDGLEPLGGSAKHASVLPVGDAPGSVVNHPEYGSVSLKTALNDWVATQGAKYYGWDVFPGMNWGYPTIAEVVTMQKTLVTLQPNAADNTVQEIWATYGDPMPPAEAPTLKGYAFLGFVDEDGEMFYDASMTGVKNWDKEDKAAALLAQWQAKVYTMTLDYNDGSGTTTNITVTYDAPMPEAEAPMREGYDFLGFFDDDGEIYYDASMIGMKGWDKAEEATLFAQWQAKDYTVGFDYNDGRGTTTNITVTYDASMPETAKPVRYGYDFLGVFDDNGEMYYDAAMTSMKNWDKAEDATLFAEWKTVDVPEIDNETLVPIFISAIDVTTDGVVTLTWQPLENAKAYFLYTKCKLTDTTWEGFLVDVLRGTPDDSLQVDITSENDTRFFTMRALEQ